MWIDDFETYLAQHVETPDEFLNGLGYFTVGAALANRVYMMSPGEVSTNIYCVLTSPPGWFRKSTGVYAASKILRKVLEPSELVPTNASMEAMAKFILPGCADGKGHGVFIYDELKGFMQHVRKEYAQAILTLVTEKWQSGMPVTFCRRKDTGFEVDTIPEGFIMSFVASTTRQWFVESVGASEIGGGTMSRFLIIEATKKTRRYPDAKGWDNRWFDQMAGDLDAMRKQYNGTEFTMRSEASRLYAGIYDEIEYKAHNSGHPEYNNLVARCPQYVKKIALIHAAMACRGDAMIYPEDVEAGYELILKSMMSWESIIDEAMVGDGAYGKSMMRVKRIIDQQGGKVSRRHLLRYSHLKVKELDEIIESLAQQEEVKVVRENRNQWILRVSDEPQTGQAQTSQDLHPQVVGVA